MASVRKCHIVLRAAAWWRKDSFDPRRLGLGRHRWLSVDHPISRLVLPRPLRQKHRRLFRVGPKRFVVARGNLHGRDDLRGGYATGGFPAPGHGPERGGGAVWGVFARWQVRRPPPSCLVGPSPRS